MTTWEIVAWAIAGVSTVLAIAGWTCFSLDRQLHERAVEAHALEVKNIHATYRLQWETFGNMQRYGSPVEKPVVVSREIDAEERVQRMVSEDTIARGVEQLRDVYRLSGAYVPEDTALRSEVLSMLGGNEPTIEMATLSPLPRD